MKIFALISLLTISFNIFAKTIEATAFDTYNANCMVVIPPVFTEDGKLKASPIYFANTVVNIPSNKHQDLVTHQGVTYRVDYSIEKRVHPAARYVNISRLDAKTGKLLGFAGNSFDTMVAPAIYLQHEDIQAACIGIDINN